MGREVTEELFFLDPAVFAIEDDYCIIFNTLVNGIGWVEVNGEKFITDYNGALASDKTVHKAKVPMRLLDEAASYEVVFFPVYDHRAVFSATGAEQRKSYCFKKPDTTKQNFNIYHISDTHSAVKNPVSAASYFGSQLDLLVMNGDIPNHSCSAQEILTIFKIASEVTHGSLPIVFARGNHDTRGKFAAHFSDYTPTTDLGNSYYTFRIGNIWGMVLDCGEDKGDCRENLSGIGNFTPFRKRETEFIRSVVQNKQNEYEAEGVERRMVLCHIRIDIHYNDFEFDTYKEWLELINEINPDVVLYGHEHTVKYLEPEQQNVFGVSLKAPCFIGGDPRGDDYKGLALTIDSDGYLARFTNKNNEILQEYRINNK